MSPAATAAAPARALSREELLRRPVTGREVVLREDESIVSTTDPRGVITSVNGYFVEISGYSEAELIGQPHHLIRHPEMPAVAFADMWAHLKKGRPWTGLVKNRCKNGDHYWVQANVTPIIDEGGQISGYMSLRRKASAEQIAEAERAYAAIRANPAQAVEIVNGRVGKPYLLRRLNPLWRLNLTVRLYLLSGFGIGLSALLMLLGDQGWSSGDRWLIWAAGLAFALYSAFWLSGDVVGRLDAAKRAFRHIAAGNFREPIDVSRNDEIGSVLLALKSLQIRLGHQVEQLAHEHRAAARINQGLDVAATNIMLADRRFNIVFANRAVLATFRKHEAALGKAWPGFRADSLVGSNIDRFHRDPAHQRRMLPALRSPHRTRMELVGLTFDLTVTPVAGKRGDNIGYVVEWLDRTDELAIEQEIEHVVEGASHGQIDRRISEAGKSGHVLHLSQGINRVLGSVTEAIGAIQTVLAALAKGDLRQRVNKPLEGAFGAMARDANSTVDTLADIVGRIQEAVGVITTAASEIAAGNTDLSERTEQQAANLEETASSMEELTATVQQNASSARSARGLAEGVSQIARRGGEVVGGAVQTMSEVTRASKKIEEIISVMDGVAFQTNILALNAAVEAARAGEMGRGFAVVASEVRSLAQRSAESAKEIKQLIGSSVQAVTTGARQVNEAGHAISELVAEVGKVSGLVAEISAASDEQAEGIGTVNSTITQLDNATQQNAALVEQATAAARSMEQQARELADAVSRFRVG